VSRQQFDAAVIGSGPNGLCAAIALAQAGRSVVVFEARDTPGGGVRSTEDWTQPGFVHDICSAIHPMAAGSPFLNTLNLQEHGLEWVQPPIPMAHPFDDGPPALLHRSLEQTGETLGIDADTYPAWMGPFVSRWDDLAKDALAPLGWPNDPILMARFGWLGFRSGWSLAKSAFQDPRGQAFSAGLTAHSVLPLEVRPSAAIGLMLGIAGHAVGWPLPKGGAASLTKALVSKLQAEGGELRCGHAIESLDELPVRGPLLFDTSPRAMADIAGDALPASFSQKLHRFRHGPGIFKMDFALDGPIPWKDPECSQAGTVHLGSTLDEIAASERAANNGVYTNRPFVILAQQSLFDSTRAPEGKQVCWAYCHVPSGSKQDRSKAIQAQIERFAPGFRDRVLETHCWNAQDFSQYNPNYIGGDVNGGVPDLGQLFTRPTARAVPYSTPNPRLFLCSASTPPGGGVHGMCGAHAAQAALDAWPE